jgi:hypothetical protein
MVLSAKSEINDILNQGVRPKPNGKYRHTISRPENAVANFATVLSAMKNPWPTLPHCFPQGIARGQFCRPAFRPENAVANFATVLSIVKNPVANTGHTLFSKRKTSSQICNIISLPCQNQLKF